VTYFAAEPNAASNLIRSFPSSTFHIQDSLHAVNLAHSVNVKLNIFANGRLPTPGENLRGASRKCNFPLANDSGRLAAA
jgi:hypothetical protein